MFRCTILRPWFGPAFWRFLLFDWVRAMGAASQNRLPDRYRIKNLTWPALYVLCRAESRASMLMQVVWGWSRWNSPECRVCHYRKYRTRSSIFMRTSGALNRVVSRFGCIRISSVDSMYARATTVTPPTMNLRQQKASQIHKYQCTWKVEDGQSNTWPSCWQIVVVQPSHGSPERA